MKKIFNVFVLVAAAAMTLASCQKNEMTAPEKQEVLFTINSGLNSKTVITETTDGNKTVYKPSWDGNEKLGILFSKPASEDDVATVFENRAAAGTLASFQGSASVTENGTFYSFCPADAFKRGYAEGDARLDLKTEQKPTATSFDPSCDILVAKPYDYTVTNGEVVVENLEFARIMSVLRINLKSDFTGVQNEFVESVSFTAAGVKLAGYARIFLENPDFTGNWASSGELYCTVTAKYDSDLVSIAGEQNSVYIVVAPVEIPAGKELTFAIKTKNYNITKTVTAPEVMKLTAGKVGVIDLSVKSENCDKIDTSVDYSGEYLITGTKSGQVYAASAFVSGNNNLRTVAVTIEDSKIPEVDGLSNCKMTVTKVKDGDYAGMYTIEDANSTFEKRSYLYAAGSEGSGNYLKATANLSLDTYWDIAANEDGTWSIVATTSDAKSKIMQFYSNSDPMLFSCYSSAQSPVTLYPYSMVVPDTTPKLEVAETLELTSAEEAEGTIAVRYENLDVELIEANAYSDETCQTECDWLIAEWNKETKVIDYVVSANDSEDSRTAYVQVYAPADEARELTDVIAVTQAGKPVTGEPIEVTDVLTSATTGSTGRNYTEWSGITSNSAAVYAGQSAGGNSSIQIRSESPAGIVTTASGGKLKKVRVTWHSNTTSGRYITIYGKNTAYSSSADLYDTNKGTSLGTITCGTSTELTISGDYEYLGILANGALYLSEIKVVWETSSVGGETPDPTPDPTPEPTTYTYTFTSKAWADDTSSWISGKDGGQMQSGRGVRVSTTYTGANATCKTSMNNVQKVVFVYSTNASDGAGTIKVSIGNQEKTLDVTKTGGETDRNLEFDFSDSPLSGQLKFIVTCTTNSIYIKSVSITAD